MFPHKAHHRQFETPITVGPGSTFGPGWCSQPGPKVLFYPRSLTRVDSPPPLSRLGGPGWESGTTGGFQPGQITCSVVVTGFQTDGVSYVMAPSARLPNQGCAEPCRSLIVPRVDTQVLDCLKTWFISATTSIQDGRLPHSAICMLMIP